MKLIERKRYSDKIEQWIGKDMAIVLTGQRRVGKSSILKCMQQRLSKTSNVIYVDKEQREFDSIRTYQDLNAYIDSKLVAGTRNYILVDEIQDISEFERTVRSFYSEPDVDIIVTGSNAKMLSGDITTLIGGRYIEIYVQPLSYDEFLTFHNLSADSDQAISRYVEYGGMPGLVQVGLDKGSAFQYLRSIYDTTLLKDVVMRNQIRNIDFLVRLIEFLADNEGKLISATNISNYMKSAGVSTSPAAVIGYLKMLEEAYLIHKVRRYDIHGKRLFESNEKYYFEDHGIRNAIAGGSRAKDIEKVMEGIVYQHLVRLGYTVYVGQLQVGEIDFVCTKPSGERAYIQVAYIVGDEATRECEFGNLKRINDNYPKYVISLSPLVDRTDDDGITHLHLRRFLTDGLP